MQAIFLAKHPATCISSASPPAFSNVPYLRHMRSLKLGVEVVGENSNCMLILISTGYIRATLTVQCMSLINFINFIHFINSIHAM